MNAASQKLFYTSSAGIVHFVEQNPIDWGDPDKANGPGNQLKTPTPVFEMFYRILLWKTALFNQIQFYNWAVNTKLWNRWFNELDVLKQLGLKHRLFRNFYPAAIDQIYAYALLVESRQFKSCLLCPTLDAVGKTDIILTTHSDRCIKVALSFDSPRSRQWECHKEKYRGEKPDDLRRVYLPNSRERNPGNKRWFNLSDFDGIIEVARQDNQRKINIEPEQLILL